MRVMLLARCQIDLRCRFTSYMTCTMTLIRVIQKALTAQLGGWGYPNGCGELEFWITTKP